MRVLEINTSSFSQLGITIHLLNYYQQINPKDVQADFIANGNIDERLVEKFESMGFHVIELSSRDKKMLFYFKDLYRIIKKERYDIVRVHGSSAAMCIEMLASMFANVKVRIIHAHNTKTNHKIFHKLLCPLMLLAGNTYYSCGNAAGKFLFNSKSFEVIPNGINIEQYAFNDEVRQQIRNELGIGSNLAVAHVGNINPQKNHTFLIDIIRELVKLNQNYLLICVGSGDTQALKKLCRDYGIEDNVMFLGARNDVSRLIQGFDIGVLPSLFEGLPTAVVEWQAAGLPCLISDTITQEVKFSNSVQYISLKKGATAWAVKIDDMMREQKINRKHGVEAVRLAGYDIQSDARQLVDRYNKLIRRKEKE